jgi:hypothetical protein
MVEWCGQVSVLGKNWSKEEENEPGFDSKLLYGAKTCLVTTPNEESSPAARRIEARLRAGRHARGKG